MNKTMEVEVRRRSLRCSQNKQNIEVAEVHSPPAQHSEKRLPNKGSQQSSSMLNQHNNDNKDEWQCPECSQKEAAERKLLEMEKNKPAEVNTKDGGQMPETENQNSPAASPGYNMDYRMSSPNTKPQSTVVTSESSDGLHRAFILKVDCFTALLLAITIGMISGLIYWNVLQGWQQKNLWFWLKLLPATIILLFIIDWCENNCKKFPLNLMLPLMITIIEGLVLGVVSSFFAAMTVMQVGGITAFVTLMLSWVALKSKMNVTHEAVPFWTVVSVLIIFGLLSSFKKSPTLQLSYALAGMLTFAIHLMLTQVRIRRDPTKDQEPIDYARPALNLYIDIVNLFFFTLQLMEHVNCLDWGSQPQGQRQQ
ncbi:protein lifeguard 1-like [Gopherus flavomarginatus]|uniref:protein lifeguard 1-like n=1 Tax=Gopherus flavomarginatus TaxID=286002 RepID=UPI0021CBD03C|nr:protein lifeguard 1-like [Gopherus flavomarginatus]XP_050795591.1 protein lifeguard 1-like [Gopherus flavomarginatus]XP_050795593.1 protein lifeguard 1-like [Gopherus flavomarginatus]XP_050795594.1 protein lifeguard 1-like [Gopherus flavomarginatus]XP_050795595.1 protein lifeguard 1-like [Gopherus flavomarginatus]